MTEFSRGIFKVIASTSAGRALVYTIGHVCIAMTVVSVLTGASLWEAGLVALVEPTINGFWYYLLDKIWSTIYVLLIKSTEFIQLLLVFSLKL